MRPRRLLADAPQDHGADVAAAGDHRLEHRAVDLALGHAGPGQLHHSRNGRLREQFQPPSVARVHLEQAAALQGVRALIGKRGQELEVAVIEVVRIGQ